MSKIKRAVSFYSLQDSYARGKMDLEASLKFLTDMGVEGVEILSDQMIHGAPKPSETTLSEWDSLVKKYPLDLVCNDIFINTCLYKNRTLTTREATGLLIDELKMAHRLGFPMVRLVSNIPNNIIEPALETAERLNVVMALEVHGGMSLDHPATSGFVDEIHRLKSDKLGLVIDAGIFCRRHPRLSRAFFEAQGLSSQVADFIDGIFEQGIDPKTYYRANQSADSEYADEIPADLKALVTNHTDMMYCIFAAGYENSPFSILDEHMPYIKHIHGKVYEMTEAGDEYSISYKEFVKYLHDKGFEGYIASEYEGSRFTPAGITPPELEQVERHQKALKSFIEELDR